MAKKIPEQAYNPGVIEKKWQESWGKEGTFKAINDSNKKKFYVLVEFPYPSGDLHMGHWYAFTPADVYARFKRMNGYEVLFPVGFDAFGLPAENAAIQHNIHPKDWTYGNIERMSAQFESMGPSFDWSRVVVTCDIEYYRWTQWVFLKMYDKGLAYRANVPANWCPKCQTVLANEQVENGKCWRHPDAEVIQKEIEQWLFKITDYAEKLLWDEATKEKINWPQSVVDGQNNWIGKSEGILIKFSIFNFKFSIDVYTRFPETIFGVTFMVIAPEHPLAKQLTTKKQSQAVKEYIQQSKKKSALDREALRKDKTGVFTGSYCINPANGEKVPVWIADYVIATYGTGAVMGVPASDHRDFAFAKKYDLPVIRVIGRKPGDTSQVETEEDVLEDGFIVNSGKFDGTKAQYPAKEIFKNWFEENGWGRRKIQYHLHDWTISRQRYWGAPIPMIHCDKCGILPVPEKDLPVELPYKVDYTPTGTSPLGTATDWIKVQCPNCGSEARRDTDTMDTFVDSSWYFFRFVSPKYDKGYADPELIKEWMPVDIYFGGPEHTLGHTMYARFITKVLYDLGCSPFDEFAQRRVHHGIILGPDGSRMSKSKGNVVNPDVEVQKYGADTVRMYLCFMAPHDAGGPWDPKGITGVSRFLKKVWNLAQNTSEGGRMDSSEVSDNGNRDLKIMHKTIKGVTEDLEALKFNTAIAKLMEWLNHLTKKKFVSNEEYVTLLRILAPFAPFITEELWNKLGHSESIHKQPWPTYDSKLIQETEATIPVQVDGKVRDVIKVQSSKCKVQSEVEAMARKSEKVSKYLEGVEVKKVIFVPGKLINFVVGS